MVSSRRAIACILLSLSVVAFARAQSGAAKEQTASVSGKVTVTNQAVVGIIVVATEANHGGGPQRAAQRGTTDYEGNYRINDIPAGNYYVYPLAPALVEKSQSKRLLTIAAGEAIRDVDFAMVRGGVITGRITNADGQPLVEESVDVTPVDVPPDYIPHGSGIQTDDRGIYRAFGLRQGKYKVSVGRSSRSLPGFPRPMFSQTFYPSVTDIGKATVIEVTEGGEIKDVDIVVVGSLSTFTVSGRVIDGNGKPLPGIILGIQQTEGSSTISSTGGDGTNSNGEFKLQNLIPGKYTLFIAPLANSDVRADPISIEVIDRDLTGLEFKTKKGASLSGMVVLDGSYEKSVAAILKGLRVYAWVEKKPTYDYDGGSRSVEVGADGSFKLIGLTSGNARLGFVETNESKATEFEILQVEHNGVVQPSGVSIKEGEQVDGVRIVVRHLKLTGAIRGQVKIENGELPPSARIVVWVNFADRRAAESWLPTPEVDSRGRFLLDRLPAGTYELRAAVFEPGKRLSRDEPKQVITVTDNAVTEVNLTVKLKP